MDYDSGDYISDESPSSKRSSLLTWPALLALAWLVYEFTSQPNLGAAFICAKFGWNDFRAALWLRRADPDERRAQACFWFYLASGLWKMAITATLTIFLFAFLSAGQRPPPQQRMAPPGLPGWFGGVVLTALMGFGLSTLTTCLSLWLAVRHEVKFWLCSNVHRFRRRNQWPPYDMYKLPNNQAGRVLLTALILLIAPVLITICVIIGAALGRFGPLAAMGIVLVSTGVGPVVILILRDVLNQRFVARTPWECWGERAVSGSVFGPGYIPENTA